MKTAADLNTHRNNQGAQRLRADEAAAVLLELRRQSEQRLLDACQEFQDIAFEMEWRMRQWHLLGEQQKALLQEIRRRTTAEARFNAQAKKRTGKSPSDRAWQRLGRQLATRKIKLEAEILENSAAIKTRNEEGRYLEDEIIHLQQRVERIMAGLRHVKRPLARVVRTPEETEAALARLSIELSVEPDVADIDVLIVALGEVDARLRQA